MLTLMSTTSHNICDRSVAELEPNLLMVNQLYKRRCYTH